MTRPWRSYHVCAVQIQYCVCSVVLWFLRNGNIPEAEHYATDLHG